MIHLVEESTMICLYFGLVRTLMKNRLVGVGQGDLLTRDTRLAIQPQLLHYRGPSARLRRNEGRLQDQQRAQIIPAQ